MKKERKNDMWNESNTNNVNIRENDKTNLSSWPQNWSISEPHYAIKMMP